MNTKELEQMSGFTRGGQNNAPVSKKLFNEVDIDGNTGIYKKKYLTEDKVTVTDEIGETKEKFRTTLLDGKREMVLVLRRDTWQEAGQQGKTEAEVLEYFTNDDQVTYKDYRNKETKTVALDYKEIKSLNKNLKLKHIVYALDLNSKEVFRFIIKGSSVSHKDPKTGEYVSPFNEYLEENPRPFAVLTQVEGKTFKSQLGTKYFTQFSKVRNLTEDEMALVGLSLKNTLEKINGGAANKDTVKEVVVDTKTDTKEAEDFDPEEIDF